MAYRFIAFDLDDTALHSDHTLSDRLRRAARRAAEKGCLVAISSGRIYRATKAFSDFIGVDAPVINCQGAIISNSVTGEVLYERTLEKWMLCEAVDFFRGAGMYVQANTNSDFFYERDSGYARLYGALQHFDGIKVGDLTRDLPVLPAKVLGMDEPDAVERLYREACAQYAGRMEVAISNPKMLEFTHPEATKGNALAWICGRYGIEPEEMIAVGDSLNDLPMIRFAGLGAAVANAREEVLEEADLVVPSNDDDGVAYLIEKYMLCEA